MARRQANQTEQSLGEVDDRSRRLRGAFGIAAAGAVGLAAALYGLYQVRPRVAGTFATIEVMSQASQSDMALLREEAERIGIALPVSMEQAANAMLELSRAGFSAKEQLAATSGVAELAIAAQTDMATAADITVSALRAFGLEADNVGNVTSVLANVAAESQAELIGLGEALSYSAAAAHLANQSVLETTAALGAVSSTLRGSQAGTSLQAFFARLANQSGDAEDRLQSLNITMGDLTTPTGEFRDLGQILLLLRSRFRELGITGAERMGYLYDIFGRRGGRLAAPLIENVDKATGYFDQLGSAAAAQTAVAIDELGRLNQQQLAQQGQAIGFELSADMTTEDVMRRLDEMAPSLTDEQLTRRIQFGLDVEQDTAEIVARDIREYDWQTLARSLNESVTQADLARARIDTLGGQVEQLSSGLSVLTLNIFSGASPAIMALVQGARSLTGWLNKNEGVARALGTGLVIAAGAATVMALATGALLAKQYALAGAQNAATVATWGQNAAQNALSASYWRSIGASIRSTAVTGYNTAARWTNQAAGYAAAAGTWALNTASWASVPSLGAMATGLYAAAAGAWALMAPFLPILAVVGVLAGAFYAWETNLWGVRDATDAAAGVLMGGLLWGLEAVGGAVSWVVGGVDWLASSIMSLLTPANLMQAALFAIPGLGVAAFLFDLAGGMDTVHGAVNALLNPVETAKNVLGSIPGVGLVNWADVAALAFRGLTNPIGLVQDGVQWLLDKIPNLPDPKDVPLLGEAIELGAVVYGWGQRAGAALADGFAGGARANKGKVGAATGEVAAEADKRLPHSPAQVGPLATLDQSGPGLVRTFAAGIRANAGQVGDAVGTLAYRALAAVPGELPSPALAPIAAPAVGRPVVPTPRTPTARVDVQTGRVPPDGAFTPDESLSTRVTLRADTRRLRAQIAALSPVTVRARLTFTDTPLGRIRRTLADVSPLSGMATEATRVRSELVAAGRDLATWIGGLSLPGGDVTVGEIVTDLAGRAADVLGLDIPALPALGVEAPGQIGVEQTTMRPPRERPIPLGGFAAMTTPEVAPEVTPTVVMERSVSIARPPGPPGPSGSIGPVGPMGTTAATAVVGGAATVAATGPVEAMGVVERGRSPADVRVGPLEPETPLIAEPDSWEPTPPLDGGAEPAFDGAMGDEYGTDEPARRRDSRQGFRGDAGPTIEIHQHNDFGDMIQNQDGDITIEDIERMLDSATNDIRREILTVLRRWVG